MGATIVFHCACAANELPLAAALLADELSRSNQAVDSTAAPRDDEFQVGVWSGLGAPSVPLNSIASAQEWLVYAGDPSGWKAGLSGVLQRAGADFVLAERFPDEWPAELPKDELEWLVEHWMPLPVSWGEPTEALVNAVVPKAWIVVMKAGEETEMRTRLYRRSSGSIETRSPSLALVEAGFAELLTLRGSPMDWEALLAARASAETGIAAASRDPVMNLWLWSVCAKHGRKCFVAELEGSPWRWVFQVAKADRAVSDSSELRRVAASWIRCAVDARRHHGAFIDVATFIRGVPSPTSEGSGAGLDSGPKLRRIFGAGGAAHNPVATLLKRDRRLGFWRALLDPDADVRKAALELPAGDIADATCALVHQSQDPAWDLVFRGVEDAASFAWDAVEAAMKTQELDRKFSNVWPLIASGLFLGAADALTGGDREALLKRASSWLLHREGRRETSPFFDPRCVAIPVFLATGHIVDATRVWEETKDTMTPTFRNGALWRSFVVWLPLLEAGRSPPTDSLSWLSDKVSQLEQRDDWRPSVAMVSSCLRLYGVDATRAFEPLQAARATGHVSAFQLAAFSLFCWLREEIDMGLRSLSLVGDDWPEIAEEQFPIFCAYALFQPDRARAIRHRFLEPGEAFFSRRAPAHTRCFFGSLALASLGDVAQAHALRLQALREDPLAVVRSRHWIRVGLGESLSTAS